MLREDEKWYAISLRLFGDNLDLRAATAALGLEPSTASLAGEHIRGDPRYARHKTNFWRHSFAWNKDRSFENQLERYVAQLEKRGVAVRELTAQSGIRAELFVGVSSGNGQGGFTLPALLLARIAALGIDLSLDLYPPTIAESGS